MKTGPLIYNEATAEQYLRFCAISGAHRVALGQRWVPDRAAYRRKRST